MTDLDPESLHVLELARAARTPNEEDKARVGRRVALAIGVSTAATAAGAASSSVSAAHAEASASLIKTAGGAGIAKWLAAGALLAAAAAGYIALSSPAPQVAAPRSMPAAAPAVAPAVAPPPSVQAPAPDAPRSSQVQEAQPDQRPDMPATAHRVVRERRAGQDVALSAELELLHRAQSAWRARQADDALSLLNEHRTRYPHSQLGLERDALQVLTLCELGRTDQASRLARSVLARAPHTPLRASLEQSCALK